VSPTLNQSTVKYTVLLVHPIGNDNVPKIITNDTIHLFF